MIPCRKSKAGFTLFGVFDGRAFFGLHVSELTDGAEYFDSHLYFVFSVSEI